MKLSIVIPAYNEEKTIKTILAKVVGVKLPDNVTKEIIVVDDGSNDRTKFKIKNSKLLGLKKIFHAGNLGKGAAIKSGLKVVSGDYIIIQDADLEYNPNDYVRLLEPILENSAQVVYGTRLITYPFKLFGKNKTVLPLHLIANKFLTSLTNLLYGGNLTDMETCYKLIKRNILQNINLKSNKFDFEPEITAKILKLKTPIVEVPIQVKPRTYKEGKKIKWTDGLMAIWTLIKYRFTD